MTLFEIIFWPLWGLAVWAASDDQRMIRWQYIFASWVEQSLRDANETIS